MCACKYAIITGASSGLGKHLAKSLFSVDDYVIILACRSKEKTQAVISELVHSSANREDLKNVHPSVHFMKLDLASLKSVREFAQNFSKICSPGALHLLVNNAGIMNHPRELTDDGIEITFSSNYFGHFYLTKLISSLLNPNARILNITSSYYENCSSMPTVNELMREESIAKYTPTQLYSISKLAMCLHVIALDKIFKESDSTKNIKVVVVRPGFVRGTELGRYANPIIRFIISPVILLVAKNLDEGVSTMLKVIRCSEDELISGKLYYNMQTIPYKNIVTLESAINLFHESENVIDRFFSKSE